LALAAFLCGTAVSAAVAAGTNEAGGRGPGLAPVPLDAPTGQPLRTYAFACDQIRVTRGRECLHACLDRPLWCDRALDPPGKLLTAEGFPADAAALRRCGLDGFVQTDAGRYKLRMNRLAYQYADRAGLADFRMPLLTYCNLPDAMGDDPHGRLNLRSQAIRTLSARTTPCCWATSWWSSAMRPT
jgi:hypothetical protein